MTRPKLSLKNIRDGGIKIKRLGNRILRDMEIRERIAEMGDDDSLLADGYNDAIIGVAGGFDTGRVVYSVQKMIEIAAKELSVDHDEASEWLEYNTFQAYVGEYTPIYLYLEE